MSRFWKIALVIVGVLIVAAVIVVPRMSSSSHKAGARGGKEEGADTAPVPVTVVPVSKQDVPVYLSALGTVQALNTVALHAQVGGQLMKLNFKEGQEVKKGDVLAEIDSRTIQSQYDQAVGKLGQDQALLLTARNNLQRSANLVAKGGQQYVSQQDLDNFKYAVNQAEASVVSDNAAIRASKVQLDFTKVIAPIDGLAGIRAVDAGNIVAVTDTIVTLTQLHPIFVIFTLPEKNLDLVRTSANKALAQNQPALDVATLDRIDSHVVAGGGKLDVIDNQIDSTTGTFKLRAQFDNTNTALWPGQFVNVQLKVNTVAGGLVVPSQAVQRGPDGDYVYQVQGDNTVKMQHVEVTSEVGDSHVLIGSGLKEGEKVVTEGQFRLKPGSKVQPLAPGQVPAAPSAAELAKSKQAQGKQGGGGRGR